MFLILIMKKKYFKIKGNDSIVLKEKFNYIQYANSKVDVIKEQSKRLYYKNPEYRLIENRLVNIVNNKEYELTDKEKKILCWCWCNYRFCSYRI